MESVGRILAIDYGTKNIGLAYSDELGLTTQPLPSLPNTGKKNLLKKLRDLAGSLQIQAFVLGMPVNMDNSRGESVAKMEQIMAFLKKGLNMPLIAVDERLSTVEALEIWNDMTPRQQKRYRTVDSLAAALILERRLTEHSLE